MGYIHAEHPHPPRPLAPPWTRTQDLFPHLYETAGGAVRCVGLLERVCKFFSKNSLRDNGFSMSHTPQSSSTSLPARQIQSAPGPPTEHTPPSTLPSFTTENPAPTPWPLHSSQGDNYLPPASCGAPVLVSGLLGHDRWQVSVGVRMGMVVCSPSSWALESPHPRSSMFSNLDFHPDQNSCGYSANWRCTNCLSQNNPYILGFLLLPNVYYLYIVYFLALNILFIRMLKLNNQLNYQEHQIQSK